MWTSCTVGELEAPVTVTPAPQANLVETLLSPFTNFLRSWRHRPVTSWFEHFVTINWNAGDADVEQHVLGEVGSYGLQLGRILDAVDLLVGELDLSRLTPEQQRIVVRLEDLAASATRRGRATAVMRWSYLMPRHAVTCCPAPSTPASRAARPQPAVNTIGNVSSERIAGVYTSSWPGFTEYSGMRRCHSRSATRSSRRARCEPRQRCTPPPNALCGFTSRSKRTS